MRFAKEAPPGAAAPPRDTGGAGPGPGAAEPVMWGGAGSVAARQMLAGLGLAGLGLSRPGAWGPGFDLSRLARAAAEARRPGRALVRGCKCKDFSVGVTLYVANHRAALRCCDAGQLMVVRAALLNC